MINMVLGRILVEYQVLPCSDEVNCNIHETALMMYQDTMITSKSLNNFKENKICENFKIIIDIYIDKLKNINF